MADEKPSDARPQFDPFKPAEPRLPGVPEKKPPSSATPSGTASLADSEPQPASASPAWMQRLPPQLRALPPAALYAAAGAAALLLFVAFWLAFRGSDSPSPTSAVASSSSPTGDASTAPASPATQPAEPAPSVVILPGAVATVQEMSQPWTARKFIIRQAGARVPAMLVRIPSGSAGAASGYWAFLRQSPFGRCELELITDAAQLAEYGVADGNPMVVDPCTQSVFHPLRLGGIGPGTYARGEVVQGPAIRPPLAIELRVERGQIIAVRSE